MSRLDNELVKRKLTPSRSKSYELIHLGKVMVNHQVVLKPSFEVNDYDKIDLVENEVLKYVSRGGLKLQKAIEVFEVSLKDLTVLDIGASTGGFSDCCLKHGAKKVYSLDVGENQLHETLRNHPQIVNLENTNFKEISDDLLPHQNIDLYVCDVSFISITTILKKLREYDENFTIIILYKPQFEVGKTNLNHKGVVKNSKILVSALKQFDDFLKTLKIGILNATYSPILGQKEGNIEFLFYLKNNATSIYVDYHALVFKAIKGLKVREC